MTQCHAYVFNNDKLQMINNTGVDGHYLAHEAD